ncbi:hypothetical protein [Anaerocolumna sp. MB42-C2]|uniref:hypothetical protein n=1 Tax=Anaerocolumna sp. MB42-C2 TaxID=3070997 RepID=UPI0027E19036|nr:hypothetical protein [Anaerocolumna sp. MB42-C2]WMJ87032.1 hypothetical protein RBU59_23825 [Anaerocolumna sp. MB42-C2]
MEIINREEKAEVLKSTKPVVVLKLIILFGICAAILSGLFYFQSTSFATGKPYEMEVGGYVIYPGKTTVSDLAEAGFELSDYSSLYKDTYDITSEAEAKTRYTMVSVVKEEEPYADIEIINDSSNKKQLGDCLISAVSIDVKKNYKNMDTLKIKSLGLMGITPEKMSEAMNKVGKESEYKSYSDTSPTGTIYTWRSRNYSMNIIISNEGNLLRIESKYKDN